MGRPQAAGRLGLMVVLRPCTSRHKFRLYPGVTAGRLNRTSPTKSHTGDESEIKKHSQGLVRRGRPLTSQTAFGGQLPYKGSLGRPAVRFEHNLFWMMAGFFKPRVIRYAKRLYTGFTTARLSS